MSYFIDTSILGRLANASDVQHAVATVLAHDLVAGPRGQRVVDRHVDRLGDQTHRAVRGQKIRAGRMEAAEVVEVVTGRRRRVGRKGGDSCDSRHAVLATAHDAQPRRRRVAEFRSPTISVVLKPSRISAKRNCRLSMNVPSPAQPLYVAEVEAQRSLEVDRAEHANVVSLGHLQRKGRRAADRRPSSGQIEDVVADIGRTAVDLDPGQPCVRVDRIADRILEMHRIHPARRFAPCTAGCWCSTPSPEARTRKAGRWLGRNLSNRPASGRTCRDTCADPTRSASCCCCTTSDALLRGPSEWRAKQRDQDANNGDDDQ
jgi:hypothetical protein